MKFENFRKALPLYDNISALERTLNNLDVFAKNSDSICTKLVLVFKNGEILELCNLNGEFSSNLLDLVKKFKENQLETLKNEFEQL